jgi:tetratricopeptide (TPR) repeat protein
MVLEDKRIKTLLGFIIIVIFFAGGILLWTGPLGELFLKNRTGPRPELFKQPPGKLTILYPKPGTLFPPEIAAPTVYWKDSTSNAARWLILVESADNRKLAAKVSKVQHWRPAERLWAEIKKAGLTQDIRISVFGIRGFAIYSGSSTVIRTSPDSVAGCIFFRAVPLPFDYALKHLDSIRWHLGDIRSPSPPPALLKNLALCGNCHTFTADGKTLAMDVDYANDKGSYVISPVREETVLTPDQILTWSDYRREEGAKTFSPVTRTFGLLSQISPDGRFVVSTVKDRSVFVAKDDFHYSQLFFPVKGILASYDRTTKTFRALPGADDPRFVQSNPVWSPDGRNLYFCKAPVHSLGEIEKSDQIVLPTSVAADFIEGRKGFRYDIYRLPFDGGRGGRPVPLAGASGNGMSNFFPRPSPDGKWIVFTQARNFMLLQPDSRLVIVPSGGGTPRVMRCNTDSMNSWHSWSPNGRWLAFASKMRGPYTEILLTHVDANGDDTPPVLLERFSFPDRSLNIPEFVNLKASEFRKITDQFTEQPHYYFTMGRNRIGEKKYREAVSYFERVIEADPGYAGAFEYQGHAYSLLGEYERAVRAYDRAIALDPKKADTYINRGSAMYHLKDYLKAIESYDLALRLDPANAQAFFSRGSARAKLDDYRGALRDYDRAVALGVRAESLYYERGLCRALLGDYRGALGDFQDVVKLNPSSPDAHQKAGNALYMLGRILEAESEYTLALKYKPDDRVSRSYRAACRTALNDLRGALDDYTEALRIDPRSESDRTARGLVRIRLGDREGGCADLAEASGRGYAGAEKEFSKYCK